MKKLISLLVMLAVVVSTIPAFATSQSKGYEFILPAEFTDIRIDKRFGVYTATHKNGKTAIYDINGNKVSDDYDYIGEFDDFNTIAKKDGKNYLLGYHGIVSYEIEGNPVAFSDSVAFIDLGNNNDGRPLSYYQGNFGVAIGGKIVSEQPYEKYVQKNHYDCFKFYNGHMLYFENGKVGTVNTDFEVEIPAIYDNIYLAHEGWLIIGEKNGKYGFIGEDLPIQGKFEYDYIEPLYDDNRSFYITQKDGLYGLVNEAGDEIIKPSLTYTPEKIYPDNELIVVSKQNEREYKDEYGLLYGVIDFKGNIVLPVEHIDVVGISEGRISEKKSYDHGGFYDLEGKEVSEFNYRMISTFSEGRIFASRENSDGSWNNHVLDYDGNVLFEAPNWSNGYKNGVAYVFGKKFIDRDGNVVADLAEDKLTVSSSYWWDGANLWGQTQKDNFIVSNGEYYGVIRLKLPDKNNEPVYEYEYIDYGNVKRLDVFNEGYVFEFYDGSVKYLDLYGNEVESLFNNDFSDVILDELRSIYGENNAFSFGDEYYKIKVDGKWRIIDKYRKVIKQFEDGDAYLVMGCDDYVLIEKENSTEIADRDYNVIHAFPNEFVTYITEDGHIITYDSDRVFKLYDKDKNIIEDGANNIEYLGKGVFSVYKSNVSNKLINSEGKVIISGYNYVTGVGDNGYIGVSTYDFEGYINTDGKYLFALPKGYYVQGKFSEGLASVVQDMVYSRYGKTSYINEKGELALVQNKSETGLEWSRGGEFKNGIAYIGRGVGKAGTISGNLVRCLYDNPSDWAAEDIETAKQNNLVPLHLQNRYRKNITRESFCEIIYQLPFVKQKTSANIISKYSDTDNEIILKLSDMGIINGVGDGKFDPDSFLTREQASTILCRVYELMDNNLLADEQLFSDDNYISDWAKDAVYKMKKYGIMNGTGDNNFSPKENYTTEQSIVTILRLFNKLNGEQ